MVQRKPKRKARKAVKTVKGDPVEDSVWLRLLLETIDGKVDKVQENTEKNALKIDTITGRINDCPIMNGEYRILMDSVIGEFKDAKKSREKMGKIVKWVISISGAGVGIVAIIRFVIPYLEYLFG